MAMARRCTSLLRTLTGGARGSARFCAAATTAVEQSAQDIIEEPRPTAEDTEVTKRLNELFADARSRKASPREALNAYAGGFTMEGVSRAMFSLKDAEACTALLEWASEQPGFSYTSRLLANLVKGMCAAGKVDEVRKIIMEELRDKFQPTELVYSAMIRNYLRAENVEAASSLANEMLSKGFQLGRGTVHLVLELRFKESGIEGVMNYFHERVEQGWIPDGKALEFVIVQLVEAERVQQAYDVFNDVYIKCKEIDKELAENAHYVLMKALSESSKLDEAYVVAKSVLKRGFRCNSPPFKSVVAALAQAGRLEEANEIFLAALEKKVLISGGDMVVAFCKAGRIDSAIDVVEKSKAQLGNRDARVMIPAFLEQGRLDGAQIVFDAMLENGISPEGDVCGMLIDGFIKTLPEDDPRRNKPVQKKDEEQQQKKWKNKKKKKSSEEQQLKSDGDFNQLKAELVKEKEGEQVKRDEAEGEEDNSEEQVIRANSR